MAAALVRRAVAGFARAILPAVDHGNLDQVAEGEAVVDPHHRALRMRQDRPHRHVLVERLVGGGALQQKARRLDEPLRPLVGVIVLDFVVVPGDQRRRSRVQVLQVGIEPVLRIAVAIERQRRRRHAVAVAAHGRFVLLDGVVDVIAEEQHDVWIFVGQMPVGREIAVLIVGARHEAEAQLVEGRSRRRQGHGAADAARRVAAHEAIPIGPAGLEPADIEMHRIGKGPFGRGLALAHHVVHGGVGRDLVVDGDVAAAHAAGGFRIGRHRLGRKPRPQHEAVGPRRAGRDAEAERIAGKPALRPRRAQQSGRRDQGHAGTRRPRDQAAAAQVARQGFIRHDQSRNSLAKDRHCRVIL